MAGFRIDHGETRMGGNNPEQDDEPVTVVRSPGLDAVSSSSSDATERDLGAVVDGEAPAPRPSAPRCVVPGGLETTPGPNPSISMPPPPVSAPRPARRPPVPAPRPSAPQPVLVPPRRPPPLPSEPGSEASATSLADASPPPSPVAWFAGPPRDALAPSGAEPLEPPESQPHGGELSPDAIQTARPEAPDGPEEGTPALAQIAPRPPVLPVIDDDDDEDEFGVVTTITTITDEIRALQKGYRKTNPREALRKQLTRYDDSAEIEVYNEAWIDGLLVEELLSDLPPSATAKIGVGAHGRSDRGLKRPRNEDSLLLMPEHHVYVVADGMGGHAAGEVASQTAVDIARAAFSSGQFVGVPNVFWPAMGDELARTVEMANAEIFRLASADEGRTGMGTTLTALRISPNRQRAYIAHVGDSRCYRFRKGELVRLTTDHTVGQLFGVKGPMSAHLCRAVGIEPTVEVDLLVDLPEPGDLYLLCSDGLTKMVKERRLHEHLVPGTDLPTLADSLVDAANGRGGVDNITVLLVRIDPL